MFIFFKMSMIICLIFSWFNLLLCSTWTMIHCSLSFKVMSRSVIKLELSWVKRDQLNSILSLSWDWIDSSQIELNSKLSWVAWTQFLKIVYLLICTEFSCRLNSNLISKNRIITCMHEIFAQTEFSRTLI